MLTTTERKRDVGPSSEVTSLAIKMKPTDMQRLFGERIAKTRPAELEDRLAKAKRKRDTEGKAERDENVIQVRD